jgi:large subunit ribosomal protein L10
MPTPRKRETVKELQKLFKGSQVLIFTDYRGLSVSEISNLRRQLREKGVEYHVAKNTLTTLAAHRSGLDNMNPMLDGPTAIAFVGDDIPGAAKVLSDFVRTSKILQIRGGLAGSIVLNADQVGDLTKILTRPEYIARVLGLMQSPMSSMVNVLSGTIRSFMNVMQARVDQLKEQGDTSADTEGIALEAPEGTTLEAPEGTAVEARANTSGGDIVVETPNALPTVESGASDDQPGVEVGVNEPYDSTANTDNAQITTPEEAPNADTSGAPDPVDQVDAAKAEES